MCDLIQWMQSKWKNCEGYKEIRGRGVVNNSNAGEKYKAERDMQPKDLMMKNIHLSIPFLNLLYAF